MCFAINSMKNTKTEKAGGRTQEVKPAEAQFRRDLRREEIDRGNRRKMAADKASAQRTQHTPGPITSITIGDGEGGGAGTEIKREGNVILEIWRNASVTRVPLATVVVAPELLAVLKDLMQGHDDYPAIKNLPELPRWTQARAVIAKATEGRVL